jgi:hypothetical protein
MDGGEGIQGGLVLADDLSVASKERRRAFFPETICLFWIVSVHFFEYRCAVLGYPKPFLPSGLSGEESHTRSPVAARFRGG